ncbi:hypothetical protein DYB32_007372 [Aphanomyces invadans]|uniref:Uncharacterized protein n=1 Tax=Aphanomyces invadans TaxID=157072 RepID=A0A3R6VTK7_9STRA|nr:hypothetical protein DYB32_007372 [Aphanomyces invadans]
MAVYVRRCLLTFRHATEDQPDVDLKDEDHAAFQEALREHRVERVVVADSPPPEKASSNDTSPDDVGCVPRPFTSTTSDKEKKRGKKSSKESSAASPLSKKAKIDSKASAPPASTIPSDSTATTSMSTRPLLAAPSSHQAKQTPSDTAGNGPPQAAMTSPRKASSSTVTPPTTSALTSSKHSNSKGASSSSSSGGSSSAEVTDSMSPADKSPVKRSAPMTNSIESSMESSDGRPAPKKPRVADALPPARFQITVNADYKELDRVRRDMNKLQEEGRKLKHEGDRIGRADLTAHGVCYLRASLKFMQQALHASDLKAMYKALNDSTNANHHSKDSTSTLAQTAKLIESAAGLFNKAKDKRKVALSYKFAAIVLLTSYRLQHNMLHLYYKQLPVPSRSPDGSDRVFKPNEEPIRSLLFKEMGTMLQGFEYWKLYEACAMPDVLPTVRDPTTVDLPSLWQALDAELEPTTGSTTH